MTRGRNDSAWNPIVGQGKFFISQDNIYTGCRDVN
jgi:hypothetical protein